MELNIPANPNKITLGQYFDYVNAASGIGKVAAVTGRKKSELNNLTPATVHEICNAFDSVVDTAQPILPSRLAINIGGKFKWNKNEIQFGFIPDLNYVTTAEWVDVLELAKNRDANMLKIAEILFRPVKELFLTWYNLEPYDSENLGKYEPFIRKLPLPVYLGALAFFLTTRNELLTQIPEFSLSQAEKIKIEMEKEQRRTRSKQRRKQLIQRYLGTASTTT